MPRSLIQMVQLVQTRHSEGRARRVCLGLYIWGRLVARTCPLFLLMLCLQSEYSLAQTDPLFSDYRRLQSYYNPAAIGLQRDLLLTASYHQQWVGIQGAPVNILVSAHTEQQWGKSYHGVGLVAIAQRAGLFTRTEAQAEYAFQLRWKGDKILSIGTGLGMINLVYDGTKAYIPDGGSMTPNDPSLPQTSVSGGTFDLAAGLLWQTPKYFVGVSGRHLSVPRITLNNLYYQQVPIHINAICGYNIMPPGALLTWHPSLFASTNLLSWRVDANLDLLLARRWEVGVMYRPLRAAGLRLGALFGKCHMGYLFEMPTSQLARGNWGSHELVVTYSLPMNIHKRGSNSYKSIRLL